MDKWIRVGVQSAHSFVSARTKTSSTTEALDPGHECQQMSWMQNVGNIDPRIVEFVKSHDFDHENYTYVLVAPLGSDESWEETVNGDAFLRRDLEPERSDYGHKTFEDHACAFMHHQNSDPSIGFGDFPLMLFNPAMDRCEGIWRLDHEKAKFIPGAKESIQIYRDGKNMPISMGCRIKYDVCSLCGNKARNPSEYCDHTKIPGFGHIDALGRKMRLFNPFPLFFDLSCVDTNAAPEALPLGWLFPQLVAMLKSVCKTSTVRGRKVWVVPSSFYEPSNWVRSSGGVFTKSSSVQDEAVKVSDMIKHIPALDQAVITPLLQSEDDIDPDTLNDLFQKSSNSLKGCFSNLAACGIVLRPEEFRHLLCNGVGKEQSMWPSMRQEDIREGYESGDSVDLLCAQSLRGHILGPMKKLMRERSILYPHLAARLAQLKDVPRLPQRSHPPAIQVRLDIKVPKSLGVLYGKYLKEMGMRMAKMLEECLRQFPEMYAADNAAKPVSQVLGDTSHTKVSERAAQALLPSALIQKHADNLNNTTLLLNSVQSLNTPITTPYVGGVL